MLSEQARKLASDLNAELVLQIRDFLDHPQVCLALLVWDGGEHFPGDIHPDISHGRADGHLDLPAR